jgi:thiamine pyrophosphate-dependent acetolactate synthase large subunit-like protein
MQMEENQQKKPKEIKQKLKEPGQARGIQIDIKPEKIGLRYPAEIGLVGDSKLYYLHCFHFCIKNTI